MAADPYLALILRRSSAGAGHWLRELLERFAGRFDAKAWRVAYAGAARRFGTAALALSPEEAAALADEAVALPCAGTLDELARAVLLRSALAALPEAEHAPLVRELYQRGDNRERAAVLRALALLRAPERFLATAVDACRSHVQQVFEAIACENPYPERHFPEDAFNQLVLKALFLALPLARVRGVAGRVSPELVRMARDYASERRAAGRDVTSDLEWIAAGGAAQQGAAPALAPPASPALPGRTP